MAQSRDSRHLPRNYLTGVLQIAVICSLFHFSFGSTMAGGLSQENPADDRVQEIINSVRDEVEKLLGHLVSKFTLVSYKIQVVAGLNYFAKVDIGEGDENMVHLRVYQNLQQEVSLSSIQYPKARIQSIVYF